MIYFDNCATTPLDPAAAAEMARVAAECFGNPSSIHAVGRCAAKALADAREVLAGSIHAQPREIILTSSGTEANNFVISSVVQHFRREGRVHIVTSAVEHASIYKRLEYESRQNPGAVEVTQAGVDAAGRIRLDELRSAIRPETRLVTLLHCNNETGALLDLDAILALKNANPRALFHLDAVQSYTKTLFDMRVMPVDFLTVSAHKVYGPKGIGFAYVRDGTATEPLLIGGAQEKYRRAGTENVAAAAGFARAVQAAPDPAALRERYRRLETVFFDTLRDERADFTLNGPSDHERRMPGVFNISFPGVRNKEDLLIACDLEGVMVSGASACHSGVISDSHVLKAMGVPAEQMTGAMRVAFNKHHGEEDVREGARVIARCARRTRGA